jgi:hypothetical protein
MQCPPVVVRFAASRAASLFRIIQYGAVKAMSASAIVVNMLARSAAIAVAVEPVLVVGVMPFVILAGLTSATAAIPGLMNC